MNILFLDEIFDGALDSNSIDSLIDILHKLDENNNIRFWDIHTVNKRQK